MFGKKDYGVIAKRFNYSLISSVGFGHELKDVIKGSFMVKNELLHGFTENKKQKYI